MSWEGLNRRKFPRAKFPCLIKIITDKEQDAILSHTENISASGVCIILRKQLELFSPVGIELDLMDGGDHLSCRAKAVWSVRRKATEPEKPSFYDTGLEFMDVTDEDKERVQEIVAYLVKTGRSVAYT